MDIHRIWTEEGKSHQGPTNIERLRIKAVYKKAVKDAQKAPKTEAWSRLHSAMATNETDKFWKSWRTLYSKNKTHLPPVVDGNSSKDAIAESFRQSFEANARPNNKEKVTELDEKFSNAYVNLRSTHSDECECDKYVFSLENVFDAVLSLKKGKSADDDGITAEHFLCAPYNVFVKLMHLFNAMLRHAFVPNQFTFGSIIPILKDHHGNRGDVNNYRGITISPIASKILEHALKIVFGKFFDSSPWQFGFKRKSSTTHALYCLKETVDYYINNGSRVFCAFLDASKAFDRLVHSGLFLKLIDTGVPLIFLELIMHWYGNLQCRVNWDGTYSRWFDMKAGVRQGGILSPNFYCLYVDELISILEKLNIGCYILEVFMAALLYADDMALLAPSMKGLQLLLDDCSKYCFEWDICLNSKKSKILYFGKTCGNPFTPKLNGASLEWVDSWNYLGVQVVRGSRFGCTVTDRIKKFYRCANAIFRIEGRSDDETMMRLVESHCLPILTYGMESARLSAQERSKRRCAYNLYRKYLKVSRTCKLVSGVQLGKCKLRHRRQNFLNAFQNVMRTLLFTYFH